jgi:hypothetical protein
LIKLRWLETSLVVLAALVFSACFPRPQSSQPRIDTRDLAVYRTVAESVYLGKAAGRAIAIVNRTLDTTCARASCPPLTRRWGLDSLWWAPENATLARQIRAVLITRAGRPLVLNQRGTGNPKIVLVEPAAIPGDAAGADAWKTFQNATAVAVLQFSPVGFSEDRSRALVVVRMRCGPRCGHWLAVSLTANGNAWTIGEELLVASDR